MTSETLSEAIKREAMEFSERRRVARMQSNLSIDRHSSSGSNKAAIAARVEARMTERESVEPAPMRDPCGFCGVRADMHDEFGCKRWRVTK